MYLLKSLRTTSAPPSTLVDTVAREEKHPVPKETGEGKVLAGKHCKTQEGATGREIYVFLAGTRFHIPQFFFLRRLHQVLDDRFYFLSHRPCRVPFFLAPPEPFRGAF